jgi:hypothetical protein
MTMRKMLSVVVMAAMFAAACGKSEEQKQAEKAAEELKKAAEAMGQAAAQAGTAAAAQGTTDMAKAMAGMAAAMNGKTADGKPIEPVPFQTLQTALPEVSGWKMDKPRGERMNMPVAFSGTSTNYRNGEQRIDLEITDTARSPMVMGPFKMLAAAGYSRESSDGYEKATSFGAHSAYEKWSPERKAGEFSVLVADRFVVQLKGRRIDDIATLRDFAGKIDLGKIAAMQ